MKQYTQVRACNGGGVVTIRLERNSSYNSLLERAKEVYFPNGISIKHGSAVDLDLHLANFRGQTIDRDNFSLDVLHQESGSRLRIYLMSKPKRQLTPSSSMESDSSLLDPLLDDLFENKEGPPISTSAIAPLSFPAGTSGTPTVSFKGPSTSSETSKHNVCGICADRQKESFFVPCGHALCTICAEFLEEDDGICPFCKIGIQKVGRLFE